MRNFSLTVIAGVLLFGAQTASFAQGALPGDLKVTGGMLVDAKGMTLYTYDKDTEAGKSSCVAQCLAAWPAATGASSHVMTGRNNMPTRASRFTPSRRTRSRAT